MLLRSLLKRAGVATGAATALVLVGTTAASAHDCFIPMYTLNAPHSANWLVFSAEDGAALEAGYTTECDAARAAGYAALEDAGLPVAIRIFGKMTIGEGNNLGGTEEGPTGSGQGAAHNPNGANGKGLEYFEKGSPLPFEMVGTYIAGASSVACS